MKTKLVFALTILTFSINAFAQFKENRWIDKDNEKELIIFENKNGQKTLEIWKRSFELKEDESGLYILYFDEKIPISYNVANQTLTINKNEYIPFNQSLKGKFCGEWKSENGETSFTVHVNDNSDLEWKVLKDSNVPVRFWPKRTDNGFYYTLGQDEFSYVVSGDKMIDNKGNTFYRIKV